MSAEDWKIIREFPNYMINMHGEIRNHKTGTVIRPILRGGAENVRLYKNGLTHSRSVQKLLESTHVTTDAIEVLDDWITIPGFEFYEINKFGRVRRMSTKRPLKIYTNSGVYVNLSSNGRTVRMSVGGLMRLVGNHSEPDFEHEGD